LLQHVSKGISSSISLLWSGQQVQNSILDHALGLLPQPFGLLLFRQGHGDIHQISDYLIDIASMISNFGKLSRFDLEKGCIAQGSDSPGHLSLKKKAYYMAHDMTG
jgi:hypothetical protein